MLLLYKEEDQFRPRNSCSREIPCCIIKKFAETFAIKATTFLRKINQSNKSNFQYNKSSSFKKFSDGRSQNFVRVIGRTRTDVVQYYLAAECKLHHIETHLNNRPQRIPDRIKTNQKTSLEYAVLLKGKYVK